MCIICNVRIESGPFSPADQFLSEFRKAQSAMKAAAEHMLAVSKNTYTEEHARRYDMTHKRMAKLIREWNQLEEFREHATVKCERVQSE